MIENQQARIQVYLYNTSGVLVAIFDDWNVLNLQRRLNTFDTMTFSIDGDDSRRDLFELDGFLEVRRRIGDGAWHLEATLFHLTGQDEITEGGRALFTSYSRGLLDLIRRRKLLYYANTAYTLKGGAGETIIKAFVNENAGPAAMIPPRLADGRTFGLTIQPDAHRGLQWAGQRSWQGLLETIQEIADLTNVDFDIVKTGPQTFEFQCYYPQLGTDRTAILTFSPTLGNMLSPSYTLSRTEEVTRVIVLGPGSETDRHVVVRESGAIGDSPWNTVEETYDARKETDILALQAAGDAQLLKLGAQESFTFTVMQTTSAQYGRDYFLGDRVSTGFGDISTTKKIISVNINIQDGKEEINMEFATLPRK